MRRTILIGTGLSLFLVADRPLSAQGPGISPGSKLRVTAPTVLPKPYVGVVRHVRADTIVFRIARGDRPVWIVMAPIEQIDVAVQVPRSRWRKTAPLWAMGVGLAVGGASGALATANDGFMPHFGAIPFGALGAVAGLATGAVIARKTERWERVPHDALPRRTSTSPSIFILPGSRTMRLGLRAAL